MITLVCRPCILMSGKTFNDNFITVTQHLILVAKHKTNLKKGDFVFDGKCLLSVDSEVLGNGVEYPKVFAVQGQIPAVSVKEIVESVDFNDIEVEIEVESEVLDSVCMFNMEVVTFKPVFNGSYINIVDIRVVRL